MCELVGHARTILLLVDRCRAFLLGSLILFEVTTRLAGIILSLLYAISVAYAAKTTKAGNLHPNPPQKDVVVPRKTPDVPIFDYPSNVTTTAAYRYGQLSRTACEAELKVRHIPFRHERAIGVLAPVRLTGPVHGVLFRGEGTEKERAKDPHEIVDCRLVLALADSTEILRAHDIVEVRHYSMYRLPEPAWPREKPATRHMGGVAIDAGLFIKGNGRILNVDKHFHGAIGAKTCGPGATPKPATAEALELRAMLCALVSRRLFNVVLTPNYNAPHKNHFHLEVGAGKTWFLVH